LIIKSAEIGMIKTNCYLLTDEQTGDSAVIDPASPGRGLNEFIAGIAPEKIKYIILTHRHFDHVLGVRELKQTTGAQIAIHRLDGDALFDPAVSLSRRTEAKGQPPLHADILLEDGMALTLGGHTLEIIHTPGHTAGGVTIRCGDMLFTGDTLFRGDCGRTDLPTGDYGAIMRSLQKLKALPGDYKVYPGHGPASTLEWERRNNTYMHLR